MTKKSNITTITASGPDRRAALSSPLRLEILGLFADGEPLAIADMARLMGRRAGSLYHHVGLLEEAGLLRRTGTRPKGKRWETLFCPAASRFEMEAEKGGEHAKLAIKSMTAAFRMAERDFAAALERTDNVSEGLGRNVHAYRMHLRVSPELLAGINKHLEAIEELIDTEAAKNRRPSADDRFLSLTTALLPLKGRDLAGRTRGERNG